MAAELLLPSRRPLARFQNTPGGSSLDSTCVGAGFLKVIMHAGGDLIQARFKPPLNKRIFVPPKLLPVHTWTAAASVFRGRKKISSSKSVCV